MKQFLDRLWLCDSETFAQDNLWVFNKFTDESKWISIHNDNRSIKEFIENEDPILVGYNIKGYDLHILKGNLLDYDPFALKEINDWIIVDKESPWDYPFGRYVDTPPICDLMLDIVPRKSLKEIEGNLGLDITETTVEFDNPNAWNKQMFDEVLYYCKADVAALRPLLEARMSYLQTKIDLARQITDPKFSVTKALAMTNAQLVAKYVEAEPIEIDDTEKYELPSYMTEDRLDVIPQDITHFYRTMESKYNRDGTINEDASSSYEPIIANCPHKLGFGGLHGALPNYVEYASADRIILNYDAFSYYPSIMLNNDRLSRAVRNVRRVIDAYDRRKDSKFNPKTTVSKDDIKTLKLILNTLYGTSGAKFNPCYDPLMLKSVCVDGQISLIYLIEVLNAFVTSYKHIQSNTDGIMFSIDKSEYEVTINIIKAFESVTGFIMEEDRISKVIQRDVNNYIVEFENGKVKTKGGLFAAISKETFEANSLKIVSEAIVDYFLHDIPIEKTINKCDDVLKFQMIAKSGSTYDAVMQNTDKGWVKCQRVNRIFASKDTSSSKVYKIKLTDEKYQRKHLKKKYGERAMSTRPNYHYVGEEDGKHVYDVEREAFPFKDGMYILRKDTVSNCPSNAKISNDLKISIDEIDKEWYINYTNKEILAFVNQKEDRMSEKEKAAVAEEVKVKEEVTEEEINVPEKVVEEPKLECTEPPMTIESFGEIRNQDYISFLKKKHQMRKIISEYQLQNDGYNTAQKFEYAKAWQYKTMLNKACLEVGMEFDVELLPHGGVERVEIRSSEKMDLTKIKGIVSLTDIDTGYMSNTMMYAEGADGLDKGLYKAETMLIKSYVQMNFLRGNDDNDVESDSTTVTQQTNTVPTVNREEAKEAVISSEQKASEETLNKIVELVLKIRENDPEYRTDGSLYKVNSGEITQVEAVMLLNEIEEDVED